MSPYSRVPFAWRYALLLAVTHSEIMGTLPAGWGSGLLSRVERKGGNNERKNIDVFLMSFLFTDKLSKQLRINGKLLIYGVMQTCPAL